ncbi:MAG: glycosyltransferase family 39 protein [Bellilinea sp.]|jgi:4-amino-4-deoxy-L-arabinose transferase-like glycosyltransferase
MNQKERIFLWAGIFTGAGLRLVGISSREIQYDDAFSIFLSRQGLSEIVRGTAADTMPPLYYFLLHFWQLINRDLVFLRLLSVILSMAAVLLIFDLARRAFGVRAGICSVWILAISPLQIYHSQDLRMYTLLLVGQAGYYWCFLRLFQEGDRKKSLWLGLTIFGAIALYSHNLAIFGLMWGNVYLLIKKRWKALKNLIVAQAIVGLFFLPWLWLLPGQIAKVQRAFWTPVPGLVEVFQAVILFHASLPLRGVLLPIATVLSVQVFTLVAWESWKDRKRAAGLGLFVLIGLGLPMLLFAISYMIRPVFVTRGFILSAVVYLMLASRIIIMRWRGIGPFMLTALVAAAVISLPSYFTYHEFPRSQFRQAVAYLEREIRPGDVVLHDNKLSFFPMRFYSETLEQKFLADEPESPNDTYAPETQQVIGLIPDEDVDSAIGRHQRTHFVVFSKAIEEFETNNQPHPVLTDLRLAWKQVDHVVLGDLEIYTFEKR